MSAPQTRYAPRGCGPAGAGCARWQLARIQAGLRCLRWLARLPMSGVPTLGQFPTSTSRWMLIYRSLPHSPFGHFLTTNAARMLRTMYRELSRSFLLGASGKGEQADNVSPTWRWANIPLPEPHLIGVFISTALNLIRPWRLPGSSWHHNNVGGIFLGAGGVISSAAVRAASDVDLERPSTLVCTGPYTISRNPMYVGWTLLYLGGALLTRNAWMITSLPVVAGLIHRDVLREERTLEEVFGVDYIRYRKRVRRYL